MIIDCRDGDVSDDDVGVLLTRDQAEVVCAVLGMCGGDSGSRNHHAKHIYDELFDHGICDTTTDIEPDADGLHFKKE